MADVQGLAPARVEPLRARAPTPGQRGARPVATPPWAWAGARDRVLGCELAGVGTLRLSWVGAGGADPSLQPSVERFRLVDRDGRTGERRDRSLAGAGNRRRDAGNAGADCAAAARSRRARRARRSPGGAARALGPDDRAIDRNRPRSSRRGTGRRGADRGRGARRGGRRGGHGFNPGTRRVAGAREVGAGSIQSAARDGVARGRGTARDRRVRRARGHDAAVCRARGCACRRCGGVRRRGLAGRGRAAWLRCASATGRRPRA